MKHPLKLLESKFGIKKVFYHTKNKEVSDDFRYNRKQSTANYVYVEILDENVVTFWNSQSFGRTVSIRATTETQKKKTSDNRKSTHFVLSPRAFLGAHRLNISPVAAQL